jgi:hypothetical protein
MGKKASLIFFATPLVIICLSAMYAPTFLAMRYYLDNEQKTTQTLGTGDWQVLNVDGNASLSALENKKYWNPHMVGFVGAVVWNVSFSDEVSMFLKTVNGEDGHIAAGMWWTAGFKSRAKIPLYGNMPLRVCVDFDIKVDNVEYEVGGEWLRIALACAVQRNDCSVVYTELDLWDSPNTQRHSEGNIRLGGDIIYQGGDVVEFKIDQTPVEVWKHYRVDLTCYVDRAWRIRLGDRLESVYIVIESANNPVKVLLRVDNLWIRSPID